MLSIRNTKRYFQSTKPIYTIYIHYISKAGDIHKLPIKLKKHAALRLIQRFDMSIEELRHLLRTGKNFKVPEKEGDRGIVERKLGSSQIRIVYKIQDNIIWIITVSGGKKH